MASASVFIDICGVGTASDFDPAESAASSHAPGPRFIHKLGDTPEVSANFVSKCAVTYGLDVSAGFLPALLFSMLDLAIGALVGAFLSFASASGADFVGSAIISECMPVSLFSFPAMVPIFSVVMLTFSDEHWPRKELAVLTR